MTPRTLRPLALGAAAAGTALAALAAPPTIAAQSPPAAAPSAAAAAPAAAPSATAPAAGASRGAVVVSPRPGQRIGGHIVRIAVRAGAEHGDLVARLNGVAIGAEFARTRPGLRTLRITSSHGLRHGRNVLRVTARTGASTRRATVRFTLGHRRPLVGAGRARRTVAGRWVRLAGRVVRHPSGPRARVVRWSVVSAPAGSRLRARRGSASARRAAAAGLRRAASLTPAFRPDRAGRYVLRMTARQVGRAGARARVRRPAASAAAARLVSATVAVDAGPRTAVIPIDAAIDGDDPPGARSTEAIDARPGIRVGEVVYRAPWLHSENGRGSFSGRAGTNDYRAVWQVVVLHRRTLGLVWNRTYGRCTTPGAGGLRDVSCRAGADGRVRFTDMAAELGQIDNDHLVIASSHPRGNGNVGAGRWWEPPQPPGSAEVPLSRVGFPKRTDGSDDVLHGVVQGGVAMIGAGRLEPGEAKIATSEGGRARLAGYLIADVNGHYGYVAGRRESFDTRAESSCGNDSCTYAMTFAGTRTSAVQSPRESGFVVAVHDDRTLARREAAVFATRGLEPSGVAYSLADWIGARRTPGAIFVVTSLGPPIGTGGPLAREAGRRAAEAIASIGGTRHRFANAMVGSAGGYSLIGRWDAEEGQGVEALGADARLRGALAPDGESRMRAVNVSADGPPAERLQRLLIAAPTSSWPLDDQPGPRAALSWIGNQVSQLGGDPRQAYWQQARSTIAAAERAVEKLDAPSGQSFSAADFATAKRQLLKELDWVQGTRDYLDLLSRPAGESGATVWEEATRIQNRLEVELRIGREKAEQTVQAFWFGIVRSMLSLAGGASEWFHLSEKIAALVEVAAAAIEATETGWEADHDGGEAEEIEENPRVRADQLAGQLERQAQQTVEGFWRIGNAIVSDPRKLEEVGTWAGCLPNASSGGCAEGYEEYAVTPAATAQATRVARIGLEQVLYQQLTPLTFPVWDTGLSSAPSAETFSCYLDSINNPFLTAPHLSWTAALEEPAAGGEASRSRVYVMLARSGTTYIHPSEELLERMFGEVDPDADRGGLGMSPQDLMRAAERRFEPGATCSWSR